MKISEIELVVVHPFSKESAEHYLSQSSPKGVLDEFTIYYLESGDQRMITLVDDHRQIAAFAGFITRLNGRVWQARSADSYSPHKGKRLIGRIYKLIKDTYKQSVQSDTIQSYNGMKIWTKTLPSLGMHPMIFDTKTEHIIDPKKYPNTIVYPVAPSEDDPEMNRYCWILEKNDQYRDANMLDENSIMVPMRGLWYTKEKI
jgi:hypothetical protein